MGKTRNQIKCLWVLALVVSSYVSVASAATRFDVAHNAVMRLEQLVDLGKVDESFSTYLYSLKLENATTGGAAYKATLSQVPNANGKANKLELLMDANGKPVTNDYVIVAGSDPTKPPEWPASSASELAASALHHVLHINKPDYQPFVSGLNGFVLTQGGTGENVQAILTMTAANTSDKLVSTVTAQGDMVGVPIVKK